MLINYLVIAVVKKKKVKVELGIPTSAPTMLVKEMIDTYLTSCCAQNNQKSCLCNQRL